MSISRIANKIMTRIAEGSFDKVRKNKCSLELEIGITLNPLNSIETSVINKDDYESWVDAFEVYFRSVDTKLENLIWSELSKKYEVVDIDVDLYDWELSDQVEKARDGEVIPLKDFKKGITEVKCFMKIRMDLELLNLQTAEIMDIIKRVGKNI